MIATVDTKNHLLQVGLSLLATHGYNGTSIQDIVSAAGVPKGSFYYYFESKDAFCIAALQEYGQMRFRCFQTCIARTEFSPLNRLKLHWYGMLQELLSNECQKGCLLATLGEEMAAQSESIREALGSLYQQWLSANEAVLIEAQQAGELSEDVSPSALARTVLLVIKGALWEAKVTRRLDGFAHAHWLLFEHSGKPLSPAPAEVSGPFPWGLALAHQDNLQHDLKTTVSLS